RDAKASDAVRGGVVGALDGRRAVRSRPRFVQAQTDAGAPGFVLTRRVHGSGAGQTHAAARSVGGGALDTVAGADRVGVAIPSALNTRVVALARDPAGRVDGQSPEIAVAAADGAPARGAGVGTGGGARGRGVVRARGVVGGC